MTGLLRIVETESCINNIVLFGPPKNKYFACVRGTWNCFAASRSTDRDLARINCCALMRYLESSSTVKEKATRQCEYYGGSKDQDSCR